MNVSLTLELEQFIQAKVESGLYHSASEVIREGLQHLSPCSIERIHRLKSAELLWLSHEFQNPYDPNALTLNTEDHHIVGYCPRYLVHDTLEILRHHPKLVHVHVERVNPSPTPLQFGHGTTNILSPCSIAKNSTQ